MNNHNDAPEFGCACGATVSQGCKFPTGHDEDACDPVDLDDIPASKQVTYPIWK